MDDLKAAVYMEEIRKEDFIDRVRQKYDELVFSIFYDLGFSEPDVCVLAGAGRITRKDDEFRTVYYFDGEPLFYVETEVLISNTEFKVNLKFGEVGNAER